MNIKMKRSYHNDEVWAKRNMEKKKKSKQTDVYASRNNFSVKQISECGYFRLRLIAFAWAIINIYLVRFNIVYIIHEC